jgi:hypothetical protein
MRTLPFVAITALALAGSVTAYAARESSNPAAAKQGGSAHPSYSTPALSPTGSAAHPILGDRPMRAESNTLALEGAGTEASLGFAGLAASSLEPER